MQMGVLLLGQLLCGQLVASPPPFFGTAIQPTAPVSPVQAPEILRWEEWKLHFGKLYADPTVEKAKARSFEANVAWIRAHNAAADRGESSFRCGVNVLSDLTSAEYRTGYLNSWRRTASSESRAQGAPPKRKLNVSAAPAAVDWRTKNAVSPVKNQGHCGGCWAFGVIGSVEGAFAIATGSLRSLSEQQLLDCDTIQLGCSGGNPNLAFKCEWISPVRSTRTYTLARPLSHLAPL
jgi:C1A family cysteine protease